MLRLRRSYRNLYLFIVALLLAACAPRPASPTVTVEAQPSPAPDELTLYWQRDGGIAGFCDGLAVWDVDQVAVATCELGDLDRQAAVPLPPERRQQLEAWVEQFAAFELEQSDPPGVSDRLRMTLKFNGHGDQVATTEDKEAMMTFAVQLFVQMSRSS
jgi:hypothetical protein